MKTVKCCQRKYSQFDFFQQDFLKYALDQIEKHGNLKIECPMKAVIIMYLETRKVGRFMSILSGDEWLTKGFNDSRFFSVKNTNKAQ
jgi:hypothetical protein